MQLVVYAEVTSPFSGQQVTTNVFNYTYESPDFVQPVIPNSYHGKISIFVLLRQLTIELATLFFATNGLFL